MGSMCCLLRWVALLIAAQSVEGRSFLRQRRSKSLSANAYRMELRNFKGVQYSSPVLLGGQAIRAIFDSGSWQVMAISSQCLECKLNMPVYNSDKSATFKMGDAAPERTEFVGGRVLAKHGYESIRLGGPSSPFASAAVDFWQVLETNINIWRTSQADFSSIVGLSRASHVPAWQGGPLVEALLERLRVQRFAVCLEPGPANPGWLTFNPPLDLASGTFRSLDLISANHWAIPLSDVHLGGERFCTGKCLAIIDSGTSMLGVPLGAYARIMAVIEAIRGDCDDLKALPSLNLQLGGQTFSLPPSAYTVQLLDSVADGGGARPRICLPAFMKMNVTTTMGELWLLGMPFLRHFYTVFDRVAHKIHVAEQGTGCTPAAMNASSEAAGGFFLPHKDLGNITASAKPTLVDPYAARLPAWATSHDTQLEL